jgi:hypothetical protein
MFACSISLKHAGWWSPSIIYYNIYIYYIIYIIYISIHMSQRMNRMNPPQRASFVNTCGILISREALVMLVNYAQKPHESGCWLRSISPQQNGNKNALCETTHNIPQTWYFRYTPWYFHPIHWYSSIFNRKKNYVQLYPHISIICSRNMSMMYPFFVLLPLPFHWPVVRPQKLVSVPDVGLGQLLALLQENSQVVTRTDFRSGLIQGLLRAFKSFPTTYYRVY